MKAAVIIPAAGASRRFGGRSKIDEDLGGRPVLQRTIELFVNRDEVETIIVAGPAEGYGEFLMRHGDRLGLQGVRCCKGGETHRWESVRNALDYLFTHEDCAAHREVTHVAIHDAARPAAPADMLDRVFAAAAQHDAVLPVVDVPDTLKRLSAEKVEDRAVDPLAAILGDAGRPTAQVRRVVETAPREGLALAQTPQVFASALIRRAYAQDDLDSTDDASLVERLGEPVVAVEGDLRNLKITRPADIELCRRILGLRGPQERETHKRF